MIYSDYLLIEKYRPKTIDECILPDNIKKEFNNYILADKIPNLVLFGTSGIGKTTIAYALANELKYDVLYVNGSNEGRSIDTLRGVVTDFASRMSLYSNRKLIIIDEADGIPNLVQEALRAFIEEYASVCSFILTCNNKSKLTSAMISRFGDIDFTIPQDQKSKVAVSMMKRIIEILTKENIKYEKEAVAGLVKRHFPDFRRTLNKLQQYSSGGEFMLAQLANIDADINLLIKDIKDKNFTSTVELIEKMSNVDITNIVEELYSNKSQYASANDSPIIIKILSDYLDKASRTSNPKITCLAMIAEIMSVLE
jgi:DNA polymerase III delta prime subunit